MVVVIVYAESQSTDQKRTVVLVHDIATFAERRALSLMKDYETPEKYLERTGFSEADRTSSSHFSHSSIFS